MAICWEVEGMWVVLQLFETAATSEKAFQHLCARNQVGWVDVTSRVENQTNGNQTNQILRRCWEVEETVVLQLHESETAVRDDVSTFVSVKTISNCTCYLAVSAIMSLPNKNKVMFN